MKKPLEQLFQIDGKVIVITGAAGLLGKKHAEAVAAYGGIPVLLDLFKAPAEAYAKELADKYNVAAIGLGLDITDEQAVEQCCTDMVARHGKIDGLVNNAANNPKMESSGEKDFSRLENFPLDVWMQDVAVGLTGSFLCSKHFGAQIARNPAGGSIVNISSDLGVMAPDQRLYRQEGKPADQQPVKPVTYSVVKTGVVGLTRYLATYWNEQNVRCNAICPGGVENNQPADFMTEVTSRIPLGRMAQSDEYQGVLIWMLSDASSYLNGAVVPVDGGRTAW